MPEYDYHCPSNGRTIEVRHGMTERLTTWGEVCERAEIEPGKTPKNTPVERALGTGVVRSAPDKSQSPQLPPRGGGGGCACH